jgi:hypothetical protein
MSDLERAKALGMSVEEFQRLVGHDALDSHSNFLAAGYMGPSEVAPPKDKKKKKKEEKSDAGKDYDAMPEIPSEHIPFETDDDVRNKTALENENGWSRPVLSDEDKAVYYGYHIHSKDNVFGLHTHIPGGPLGGGHTHGPQNRLGYHQHRYSPEEIVTFKFARPGLMIQLDGPHEHRCNAPDGKHVHSEENFGPHRR